jgi:hypothetical protein
MRPPLASFILGLASPGGAGLPQWQTVREGSHTW